MHGIILAITLLMGSANTLPVEPQVKERTPIVNILKGAGKVIKGGVVIIGKSVEGIGKQIDKGIDRRQARRKARRDKRDN